MEGKTEQKRAILDERPDHCTYSDIMVISAFDMIRYGMISEYLTCARKLTNGQLSLPHDTKKLINKKLSYRSDSARCG